MSTTAILPETYAAIAAAVAGAVVVIKKLVSRKHSALRNPHSELVTRSEFKTEMESMRNRIGAGYLALADKIDANHKELLSSIADQGANFERRIDLLEANFARVDERTKTL